MRRSVSTGIALVLLGIFSLAHAQAPTGQPQGVPDVPKGDGRLVGQVSLPGKAADLSDLPVGLYALAADGSPSLRETTTDADGRFRFDDISNASGIVYLIGTRYREISYGKRARFDPGQTELNVTLEVSEPTTDPGSISIDKTEIELGWHGNQLAVQERTTISNSGTRVFHQAAEDRDPEMAPLQAVIPETAHNLRPAMGILAEQFELENGSLRYWGAVYPGVGEVAYNYLVPQPATAEDEKTPPIQFRREFPAGSASVVLLVPVDTPDLQVPGLTPGAEIEIRGRRFRTLESDALAPGAAIEFSVEPPARKHDAGSLEVKQVNAWLELDDTILDVNMEYGFFVAGPDAIAGTPEVPLLRLDLPANAEFKSVSSTVDQLGVEEAPGGGVDVLGPLPPGESRLSIRYRLPAGSESTSVDFQFPFGVPLFNVLVADTGIVIETVRLHRRRPTRSGTRLYLHREAFQVEPGETVRLELQPLERGSTPRLAVLLPFFIVAGIAAWFMVTPLRRQPTPPGSDAARTPTRTGREAIYLAIRDLDHDFETGKLSEPDHRRMRSELRAQAIQSMREEADSATPAPESGPRACSECGGPMQANWRFCSHCGAAVPSAVVDPPGERET